MLVHERTGAGRTIGIERSTAFLGIAQSAAPSGIAFVEHDLALAAPPCGPVDLAYCRFLLTHLDDVPAALRRWRTAFRAGAVLVIEEVEHLGSSHPVLAEYYRLISGLQAHNGQVMFIGPLLDSQLHEAGFEVLRSTPRPIDVPAAEMATLHQANLASVRTQSWVSEHWDSDVLDRLAVGLSEIAQTPPGRVPLTNVLRQIISRPR